MPQFIRFYCALLAFFSLSLSHANAQAAPQSSSVPEKAFINETSRDGHVSVEVTQASAKRRETLIIKSVRGIYRVPDERLSGYNNDDGSYDHDFHLSPDTKWLFVTRKLFHTTDIGYLYHLKGTRFIKVRPRGQRFDEAAIRFFSRHLHFPYDAIGEGPRIIYFLQWTVNGNRLAFEFHSSRHYESRRYRILKGFYEVNSRRFGLISYVVES